MTDKTTPVDPEGWDAVSWTIRDYAMAVPTLILLGQYIAIYWTINRLFGGSRNWKEYPWWFYPVALPVVIPFLIQNMIYNATVGWFLFKEKPFTWLFSDRLQHYYYEREPRNAVGEFGVRRMARVLNYWDKGHI